MDDLARTWLRRIALGLPIASPLVGCSQSSVYGCDPPIHELTFDLASAPRADGGAIVCHDTCGQLAMGVDAGVRLEWTESCRDEIDGEGRVVLICRYYEYLCEGRRPQELRRPRAVRARTEVGAWLAQAAHLEAASVPAFGELATELALHGAPPALVRGARRGERDEIAHARSVASLARRWGAAVPPVERARSAPRAIREIAIDNATEGCAREAYGALAAAHHAAAAGDPEVARAYRSIARDEARHALFSLALDAWIAERLPARDRRAVGEARREALFSLARELEHEPAAELRAVLGALDAERAVALAGALA